MFEINDAIDKRLKEMDITDYLQYMHDRIEGITHRAKTNSAYSECRELTRHIKNRIVSEYKLSYEDFKFKVGKNLHASEQILDMYSTKESDKRKEARIQEFVGEYTYDLSSLIRAAKRRKETPNSPINEEEL